MAKEGKILYGIKGFSSWPIRRTINEAENIARWNPWLAHQWMEEARQSLSLDNPFYCEFDEACSRINARWKNKERYHWYPNSNFWNQKGSPDKEIEYLQNSSGDIEFEQSLFLTNQ